MAAQTVREKNLEKLSMAGFRVAASLPIKRDAVEALRPAREIAARLMALDALFTWVAFSEKDASTKRVRAYADANDARAWLTPEERAIFALGREEARAKHVDAIGWRLENMWPLAWVLGFAKKPAFDGAMIQGEITRAILMDFLPGLGARVDHLLTKHKPRSYAVVNELEDLFYCAHNAARSAQLGGKTVPDGFHPIVNGGVIHERRHALTWCVSPETDWDDTDLST